MARTHIYNFRITKWFPPQDRFATCMARLCILQEDLFLEMQGIHAETLEPLDANTVLSRKMFFWRSLVKTIAEMRQTVETLAQLPEFRKVLSKQSKEWQSAVAETKKLLSESKDVLTDIRNSLGGHVLEEKVRKALEGISSENFGLFEVGQVEGKTHFKFTNNLVLEILLAGVDQEKRLEEIQRRFRTVARMMRVFVLIGILLTIYAEEKGLV